MLLNQRCNFDIFWDLECPKPVYQSICFDYNHHLPPFRRGGAVNPWKEEGDWANDLVTYWLNVNGVCRASLLKSLVCLVLGFQRVNYYSYFNTLRIYSITQNYVVRKSNYDLYCPNLGVWPKNALPKVWSSPWPNLLYHHHLATPYHKTLYICFNKKNLHLILTFIFSLHCKMLTLFSFADSENKMK